MTAEAAAMRQGGKIKGGLKRKHAGGVKPRQRKSEAVALQEGSLARERSQAS